MVELVTDRLSVRAGDALLVEDASLRLRTGELVALVGPNGAGKTTLLRAMLGLIPCAAGHALLDGVDVATLNAQSRARAIAYLPQARGLAWPMRTRDVVALGRFAHGAAPDRLSEQDRAAVDEALAVCALSALAERPADTLSGGETARLHLARALAARTPLLVADEPTASLDPAHQFRLMEIFAALRDAGSGALVALHDLALAYRFADRAIVMAGGRIVADGPPRSTLTPALLAELYGISAQIDGDHLRIDGLSGDGRHAP